MNLQDLKNIIDHLHDEIMIYDNSYNLVYLNEAGKRHYGIEPQKLIGKKFYELEEKYWDNASMHNSALPEVYRTKKMVTKRQITKLGHDIITIAVPIFDEQGNLQYVAENVNDIYSQYEIHNTEKHVVEIASETLDTENIFLGTSYKMQKVYEIIEKIKNIDAPCMLEGETGTGKSYIAKYMHGISNRGNHPFVTVNCACMNQNLIESELFGYKKGAFSGARASGKKGLVEMADQGTLFLDEISELPYELQAKMLLFLQDQEFIPVGGEKKKKVNVRIIAASNRDLKKMIKNGRFREDLYFRLNTFEVYIPPLRERKEEIADLADYFCRKYNKIYQKEHSLHPEVYKIFREYSWPGNLRELSHLIEKIHVLVQEMEITSNDLPQSMFELKMKDANVDEYENLSLQEALENVEKGILFNAYQKYGSSVKVGKALKISQPKAYRLLKKHSII